MGTVCQQEGEFGISQAARLSCRIAFRLDEHSLTFPDDSLQDPKPASEHKTADHVKSKAKTSLTPISNKLSGLQVVSAPSSLGAKEVGVGEQVERLIREARDPKNLGSMYVGW